ncbi:hypothetical protein AGMMS49944_00660 [Spirochaetia bacterium]|nr:hypothetical protein AGMMS49944_00660 [Spirochaetia bacterium]
MEIDYAKLHIAHQMAIRDRCVVDTGMIDLSEGDQDSLVMDSNFDYDDSHIDELIDYIEVIETYVFPGLAVVLARDNRKTVSANIVIPRLNTERPRWVHNPQWVREFPGMEDYSVGVGVAGKNTALFKGLRIADVNAAQAIAAEKNSFNRSFLYDYVNSRFVDIETGNAILTKAELYGFYILDRWLEPDGSACYSLGISLNDK